MARVGTADCPLRVAVIGAGPAGFYTIAHLLKAKELRVKIDLYERLPTPFGLVRAGVAPDHQKDKSVTRVYDRSGTNPDVCFYGGMEYGTDIHLDELKNLYHQIIFTSGASHDRSLKIPGEDSVGSHSATEFVAWYNSHPDFVQHQFDLSKNVAVIVGMGNVALDVARILIKPVDELATTDIADYALEALRESQIRDIYLLGRRGPAQAAFTPTEIQELGELQDADFLTQAEEMTLDPLSQTHLAESNDKNTGRNVELLQKYSSKNNIGASRRLHVRFWVSPTMLHTDDAGKVQGLTLQKNKPAAADGRIRAIATDETEYLDASIVFRSVGYQGASLPGIPFDENRGTFSNQKGRITENAKIVTGLYSAGWIKRGPTGVIGSNKVCAKETVECMLEDLATGRHLTPSKAEPPQVVADNQHRWIDYAEWMSVDAEEIRLGTLRNRPRVKFSSVQDMVAVAKGN